VVRRWLASVGEQLPQEDEIAATTAEPVANVKEPEQVAAVRGSREITLPPAAKPIAPKAATAPVKPKAFARTHAAEKPAILTPKKPYSIKALLTKKIARMEKMGKEMQGEINNGPNMNGSFQELDQDSKNKIPNNLP